jgi:DNA-binding MarR family transcriptional regulator
MQSTYYAELIRKLADYLWRESIQNIEVQLSADERSRFNNNDYYYLTVLASLKNNTPSEFARVLHRSWPYVSMYLKKLAGLKMIRITPDAKDGRSSRIVLTKKANSIITGDRLSYIKIDKQLKAALPDEHHWERHEAALKRVLNALYNK